MHYIFILLGFFICCTSCAQPDGRNLPPEVQYFTYDLQNTPVKISVHRYLPASRFSFILLHDNEHTAEKAALQILQQYGGRLISLENNQERTISFSLNRKRYEFDPNRMFTAEGIRRSLETYSAYHVLAAKEIERFAAFFLSKIADSSLPVAVHNNSNNDYSITDYLEQGKLGQDAASAYQNTAMDVDEFVITTSRAVYDFYKERNMNVVLQKNNEAADDGSLSIFFGRQQKDYINIEAEHGHTEMQVKMLEALFQLFPDF